VSARLPAPPAYRAASSSKAAAPPTARARGIRLLAGFRQPAAKGPSQLLHEHTQHLWATYKPCLKPDAGLLASISSAAGSAELRPPGLMGGGANGGGGGSGAGSGAGGGDKRGAAASRALRRHFQDLTSAFLVPFQPYFSPGLDGRVSSCLRCTLPAAHPLTPRLNRAWSTAAHWTPQPGLQVPHFSLEAMLQQLSSVDMLPPSLAARLPVLGGKQQLEPLHALYKRFVAGPNFGSWFADRLAPVQHLVASTEVRCACTPPGGGGGAQHGQQARWGPWAGVLAAVAPPLLVPCAVQEAASRASPSAGVRQPSATTHATLATAASSQEVELVQAFVQLELQLLAAISDDASPALDSSGNGGSSDAPATPAQAAAGGQAVDPAADQAGLAELKAQVLDAFFAMPLDLKQCMISSPDRQQLLTAVAWTEGQKRLLEQLVQGLV
jgi:hypothetical protein